MFKVNYRNTRTRCEICSKLTIKTSKRYQWRRSGVSIVNFAPAYFTPCSRVFIDFEQLNAGWERTIYIETGIALKNVV